MKNIRLEQGLKISLKVLKHLKKLGVNKEVSIGTFTNCRECGLTFKVMEGGKSFTWCVYEHRNSDEIIINGTDRYVSFNGDLPYKSDSKFDYIAEFSYDEFYQCAEKLQKLINDF